MHRGIGSCSNAPVTSWPGIAAPWGIPVSWHIPVKDEEDRIASGGNDGIVATCGIPVPWHIAAPDAV